MACVTKRPNSTCLTETGGHFPDIRVYRDRLRKQGQTFPMLARGALSRISNPLAVHSTPYGKFVRNKHLEEENQ